MRRHALNCLPFEACGLLAIDEEGRIRMSYPLTNAVASPSAFTVEPREHFGAVMHAERRGWAIGGVFHSHPGGTAELSPTDLDQPHAPEWVHVVAGFVPHLHLRVWRIAGGRPLEVPILAD